MHNFLTKNDYDKICRTCLKFDDNMTSIFETEALNMITTCTSITLTENDGLPKKICTICLSKTFESYTFKQQCENSDQLLRDILNNDDNFHVSGDTDVKDEKLINDNIKLEVEDDDNVNDNSESDDNCTIKEEIDFEPLQISDDNIKKRRRKRKSFKEDAVQNLLKWGDKCDLNTFTCKFCNKILASIYSLSRHMDTHVANRQFKIKCKVCDKGFYDNGDLKKHMWRHDEEGRYKCSYCQKPFYELTSMRSHYKTNHPESKLKCDECNKEFYLDRDLEIHTKRHTNEPHSCSECGRTFKFLSGLKEHKWKHVKVRAYHCHQCDKSYKSNLLLQLHYKRVHTSKKTKEVCTICGKSVVYLKGHLVSHTDENIKCGECGRQFRNKYSLERHVKRKHKKVDEAILNPYLCNICGKRCENMSMLKRHFVTHTDVRTHECPQCGKCFKATDRLEFHIKHTHNDVRNYKCTFCPKSFHTKSALTIHIRVHTGERPYGCKICGKAFQQRSSLTTHMRVHGFNTKNGSDEINRNVEINLPRFKEFYAKKLNGEN